MLVAVRDFLFISLCADFSHYLMRRWMAILYFVVTQAFFFIFKRKGGDNMHLTHVLYLTEYLKSSKPSG